MMMNFGGIFSISELFEISMQVSTWCIINAVESEYFCSLNEYVLQTFLKNISEKDLDPTSNIMKKAIRKQVNQDCENRQKHAEALLEYCKCEQVYKMSKVSVQFVYRKQIELNQ